MKSAVGVRLSIAVTLAVCSMSAPVGLRRELPRRPAAWFMTQRLGDERRLPARARARALERARALGMVNAAPGSWVNVGPSNIGGRVTCLGVDPNDPARIWLGSAAGGVFVSTDGGTDWSPVFDGQTALSIGSLAVHPADSNTIYVGTGEDNGGGFSYDGEGIFRSTDGGANWTALGLADTRRIGRIAIDPADPRRLFVAAGGDWFGRDAHRGIYRSMDYGAGWEKVLSVADDAGAIDVAIDPFDTNRIYAAIWQRQSQGQSWYISGPQSGVYRSGDGGASWTRLSNGLPAGPDVGRIGLAIAPSSPNIVYALVIDGRGDLFGLYRTTDAGDTWTALTATSLLLGGFSYYFGNIRVDPVNPDTVYVLDVFLFKSTDGGASFGIIGANAHPDWHDLIIEEGRLLAGNDAGFLRSRNGGSSWEQATTLPITQFYDLAIDRLQPSRRFGGTQDNGTVRTKTGVPSEWQNILGGDGLHCEVDYTNSSIVYAESQYGEIYRSSNGGNSFVRAMLGLDREERRNWSVPIALDPVVPTTLYLGYQRVWRSTDSGGFWQPISPDLTGDVGAAMGPFHALDLLGGNDHLMNLIAGTITAVSISPVDNRILWAGTDDGHVWVSADAGATWTRVDPPGPAHWVTDIACDPFDARTAWLTVTGYRLGDRVPYVRATTDSGSTWRDLGGTLPQVPMNSIAADPAWQGRLLAGSDLGVHLSDDGGVSWSLMSGGMPYVVVTDLVLHAPSRVLYAGTHGRSIFAYDMRQLPPADGDGDGVDNNRDCALADPAAYAPPGEVGPLTVAHGPENGAILSWPGLSASAGPGTVYDVANGDLPGLATGGTSASFPLVCGAPTTTAVDSAPSAPGSGSYYMVRARNACGVGTWGADSSAVARISTACP